MSRRSDNELYSITLVAHISTAKAYLCTTSLEQDKDTDGFWLPKSQLQNVVEGQKRGRRFMLNCDIPAWLAEEKGIDADVDVTE